MRQREEQYPVVLLVGDNRHIRERFDSSREERDASDAESGFVLERLRIDDAHRIARGIYGENGTGLEIVRNRGWIDAYLNGHRRECIGIESNERVRVAFGGVEQR